MILPDKFPGPTPIEDNMEIDLREFLEWRVAIDAMSTYKQMNQIQLQVSKDAYHTNNSLFLGASTGSGKTFIAELAILKLLRD